ncbi:hybrid sensor histidine kinase/response regulator [bacterium]|nr:hybrid sensor histidine kinase/response regulator [bacterium]
MEDLSKEEYIELFSAFKAELEIQTSKLNHDLLHLEQNPELNDKSEILQDIMREAHNIKGSARIVDVPEISAIAQHFETLLGAVYRAELTPTSATFDVLYRAVDLMLQAVNERIKGTTLEVTPIIRQLAQAVESVLPTVQSVSSPGPDANNRKECADEQDDHRDSCVQAEPESVSDEVSGDKSSVQPVELDLPPVEQVQATSPEKEIITPDEKILISAKKLDNLMDLVGELLIAKIKNEQRLNELKSVFARIEHSLSEHEEVPTLGPHLSREQPTDLVEHLMKSYKSLLVDNDNIAGDVKTIVKEFRRDSRHLSLVTEFLQNDLKRTRMLPAAQVLDGFERMVRDLSRKQGKKVRLLIKGREVKLDKKILEKIKDPLMHIIRNSIDHGIESPSQRRAMNKPELSQIIIDFEQRGSNIFIRIKDDGIGLDLDKLLRIALRKNLITKDAAENLNPKEMSALIFIPGLSTRSEVTDLSGRGVGMDVVKKNIENLNGLIEVISEQGQGTEIIIRIPLTLATLSVVMVSSNSEILALPALAIDKIMRFKVADLMKLEGRDVVLIDGQPIALAYLKDILNLPGQSPILLPDSSFYCLLISATRKKMALIVDDLLGEQEIVIKKLGEQDSKIQGISGAAVLGTGKVVIVLNPVELVNLVTLRSESLTVSAAELKEIASRRILVIDDSISTRNYIKNILTSAGYEVAIATDGQEGLELVKKMVFDLIVTDIQMPRMNGLEFTESIKADPQLADIPVILVSALESKEDLARGLEVGAEAYITKNAFDRQTLLDSVERLI